MSFVALDDRMIGRMRSLGIPFLRISVGIVFLWFGLLKIFNVSPVVDLVADTYPLFPQTPFLIALGFWEAMVGLGLILKISMRLVLLALWVQMAGVFGSIISSPSSFFVNGNPLLLTFEGEFLVKNLVIIAASIVVGGYEVEPKSSSVPPESIGSSEEIVIQ